MSFTYVCHNILALGCYVKNFYIKPYVITVFPNPVARDNIPVFKSHLLIISY